MPMRHQASALKVALLMLAKRDRLEIGDVLRVMAPSYGAAR